MIPETRNVLNSIKKKKNCFTRLIDDISSSHESTEVSLASNAKPPNGGTELEVPGDEYNINKSPWRVGSRTVSFILSNPGLPSLHKGLLYSSPRKSSKSFSHLNFTSYVLYIYPCYVTWHTLWAWVTCVNIAFVLQFCDNLYLQGTNCHKTVLGRPSKANMTNVRWSSCKFL